MVGSTVAIRFGLAQHAAPQHPFSFAARCLPEAVYAPDHIDSGLNRAGSPSS